MNSMTSSLCKMSQNTIEARDNGTFDSINEVIQKSANRLNCDLAEPIDVLVN